jgi:DNA-binding NarL/FixJ family response regulator
MEPHQGQPRGRFLIVEDEILIGLALQDILADAGYTIVGNVTSGKTAIEMASSLRPDFVLMDIRLGDGPHGIDTALGLHARTGIRCIFTTANADDATRRRASDADSLGWVLKPYAPHEILKAVAEAIGKLGGAGHRQAPILHAIDRLWRRSPCRCQTNRDDTR